MELANTTVTQAQSYGLTAFYAAAESNYTIIDAAPSHFIQSHHVVHTPQKPFWEVIGGWVVMPIANKISAAFSSFSSWTILPVASAKVMQDVAYPVHYPSKEEILACFRKNAFTRSEYAKEKRFFDNVANALAERAIKAPITGQIFLEIFDQRSYELLRHRSLEEMDMLLNRCVAALDQCVQIRV